jgi:hypothetical protein
LPFEAVTRNRLLFGILLVSGVLADMLVTECMMKTAASGKLVCPPEWCTWLKR